MLVRRPMDWRDRYDDAVFALRYRRTDDFRQSVRELPSAAVVDPSLENLLHHCARLGSAEGVMLLLSWQRDRPNVNGRNIRGETPLHVALVTLTSENWTLSREAEVIVSMLIDAGAQIFAQDARGNTPMNIVGKIVYCPASVVRKMYFAASSAIKQSAMPRVLLDNGWPIAASFHMNCTKLTLRMLELCPEIVKPSNDKKRNELLHMALEAGCSPDMLDLLLMFCGLEVNASFNGRTPLHVAAIMNVGVSYYKHIEFLLKAGANPNARDNYGLKPIHLTIERGSPEVFDLLLSAGSELSHEDIQPWMSQLAAANGCTSIIRHFLNNSTIDSRCYFGMTPLHYAARDRRAAAVYYLLAVGAQVDAVDKNGWTALHHVIHGREGGGQDDLVPVVGLLLHFGIDVDHLSQEKDTALHIALMHQNTRAMYQLVRHIALQPDHPKPTVNETLIKKNKDLQELHKRCMQELMRLTESGIADDANYLLLLRFTREQLIGVASGMIEVNYLCNLPEGGIKFNRLNFSPAAFPIYGNFLINRVHHANLEFMTLEEIGEIENYSILVDIISLSANEFVEFFSAKYLL